LLLDFFGCFDVGWYLWNLKFDLNDLMRRRRNFVLSQTGDLKMKDKNNVNEDLRKKIIRKKTV